MRSIVLALAVVAMCAGRSAAQTGSDRARHDALEHYRAGEQALHGERFDVAEREFREAIKLDPLLHLAHYGLGQLFMLTRRYPLAVLAFVDARTAFRSAAAQALEDDVAYERQVDEQIRSLESLRRSFDPNDRGDAQRPKVADSNATLQRIDNQIGQLRSHRRRSRDRPEEVPGWISLALGSAYFRSNQIEDAEREYREAVRVEPRLGEAHNNLAVVLMLTGRYEEADQEIKAAEKAGFRVNPQFKDDLKARRKGA